MHLKLLMIILFLIKISNCLDCDIIPEDIIKPKNRNEIDRYIIYIQGNPKTYTPNQKYNVSIKINPNKMPQKAFRRFFLTLESVDGETYNRAYRPTGQFEFEMSSQLLTRFSDACPNTVIENSKLQKKEVQVYWVAPSEGSGCVALKATVVETSENWFSEDGQLTKILCEDSEIDENVKPPVVDKCCACSEAKYEMAFEGRWTRNTHPRNYPSDVWSTKFSDIIGASHKRNHHFWREQDLATKGLKELAESGRTHELESEIKDLGTNIRTIIKARGLQHPNITDTSYAVFRVDNKNHLVSLVSKITPSPDWFVGVSNFELCKSDCTWAESYTLNLYPIDAGTNDGISYLSSEPLIFSHKPIMSITPNNPNNPLSPFYDEDGSPMNPIAKLHFTRQRLYEKSCDSGETLESSESDCAVTDWGDWTPCSTPCGMGKRIRMRSYLKPREAESCYVRLVQEETCLGTAKFCRNAHSQNDFSTNTRKEPEESIEPNAEDSTKEKESEEKKSKENSGEKKESEEKISEECAVGNWSEWSTCSAACGKGTKTRDRKLLDPKNDDKCEDVKLQDNNECTGYENECENKDESKCSKPWGPWGECSQSCGTGVKRRQRRPDESKTSDDENEEDCSSFEEVKCHTDCPGENFGDNLILEQESDGRVMHCKVSAWSSWSKCKVEASGEICGGGLKKRHREIIRHPQNGGRPCPRKLQQIQSCTVLCADSPEDDKPKCIMSDWTEYTPCSSNCGGSAMQLKTRKVLKKPPGAVCPNRVDYKPCKLPLACTSDGRPIIL